jgi:hypothetical protein
VKSVQGTGLNAARVTAAKIAGKGNFLEKFYGTDGTQDFTGTASRAQGWRNDNLSERIDLNRFLRTFGTITFPTLLTDNGIINSDVFNFNDFDSSATTSDFAGMKKRAVHFTAAAAGTPGKVKGDHCSVILSMR